MMLQVAIVVVSSKILSGRQPDDNREVVERMVEKISGSVVAYEIVPDDRARIREQLTRLCDAGKTDMILTIGGTGVRPTDWVPEATRDVIEKEVPGFGEAMRQQSMKTVMTAMLSRGTAGIRHDTLIVNLPGSAKGARDNFAVIAPVLEHAIEKIKVARQPS